MIKSIISLFKISGIYFLIFLLFYNKISAKNFIVIQSTTSTRDSGFYEYLIPKIKKKLGFEIRVIAVGTGQAIKNAKNCDGDLLLVHHKPSEIKFIEQGFGLYRKEIMYNDFVIIGPKEDPLDLKRELYISNAFKKIFLNEYNFVSRGDNSGTHMKEIYLWTHSGLSPNPKKDSWYFDVGQGMGAALNIAVNKDAYIISDRASWINFSNKQNHKIILENRPKLLNLYGLIPVNPKKCPDTKFKESKKFIDWILSLEGKKLINDFKVKGKQLFFSTP